MIKRYRVFKRGDNYYALNVDRNEVEYSDSQLTFVLENLTHPNQGNVHIVSFENPFIFESSVARDSRTVSSYINPEQK